MADAARAQGVPPRELALTLQHGVGVEPRLARRLERAYKFLASEYPALLEGPGLKASWASVLELSRLHTVNPSRAREIAGQVFSGRMPAGRVAELANSPPPAPRGVFTLAREISQKTGSFGKHALELIQRNPEVLQLGPVDRVAVPNRGHPLMPALIVEQEGRTIAVEIRAPGSSATPHQLGGYLARVAQLQQRYTRALLVLPKESENVARMACDLQRQWDGGELKIVLL